MLIVSLPNQEGVASGMKAVRHLRISLLRIILRFKRAVDKGTNYFNAAPKDERDEWVAKFTGVKQELVAAMTLPQFVTEFNVPGLRANVELAASLGVVKPFDVESMIWKP